MSLDEKKKQAMKMIRAFKKEKKIEDDSSVKLGFAGDDESIGDIKRLLTGIPAFDILTNGGFIKGHINQIYGGESSCKTTSILNMIAKFQEQDELTAYLAAEKSYDRGYSESIGVDQDNIIIAEMQTAEQNADFCMKAIDDDSGIDMLIIDTLQALASKAELYKGDTAKERSTEDNSMALLPRVYSQFLRMYTSKSVHKKTLLLASQVRANLGSFIVQNKQTGGNAIAHYNLITIEMRQAGKSNWPTTEIPPNSFPIALTLDKAKIMNRYKKNTIHMYFYKGKLDYKYNILGIGKELKVHDGKKYTYLKGEEEVTESFKGFNDMYNKISEEAVEDMASKLNDRYTEIITEEK